MIPLIEENHDRLEQLCRKYHVGRLEVFGSASTGAFDASRSDLDFLVEFRATPEMNAADQYFGLLEELEATFQRRIDLVCAKAMRNPYFIQGVNATRRPLYAA